MTKKIRVGTEYDRLECDFCNKKFSNFLKPDDSVPHVEGGPCGYSEWGCTGTLVCKDPQYDIVAKAGTNSNKARKEYNKRQAKGNGPYRRPTL